MPTRLLTGVPVRIRFDRTPGLARSDSRFPVVGMAVGALVGFVIGGIAVVADLVVLAATGAARGWLPW